MPRKSTADEGQIRAAVNAVNLGLSRSKAAKRYGVPAGTIASRIKAARESDRSVAPDRSGEDDQTEDPQESTIEPTADPRLDLRQHEAARMLVAGLPVDAVVKALHADRLTVKAWMADPVFEQVCSELRTARHRATLEALAAGASKAVEANAEAVDFLRAVIARATEASRALAGDGARYRAILAACDYSPEEKEAAGTALALLEKAESRAVAAAIQAAKALPGTGGRLMDSGGYPRTERVEHSGTIAGDVPLDLSPEELRAQIHLLQDR